MKAKDVIQKALLPDLVMFLFFTSVTMAAAQTSPDTGDVNNNGNIDALLIAQFYVGLAPEDFIEQGFSQTIGILIDTSRNGWGGPERPAGVSSVADVNTYVDESRVDRRIHRSNWCNQPGG